MDNRNIMNTENLQKRFPEVYEEFFSQNNLIVSCPQIINRGHITHLDAVKFKIAQKLPTKMYIGVNIRKDDKLNLRGYLQFKNLEKKFVSRNIEITQGQEIYDKMKQTFKETLSEFGIDHGLDVMMISENEVGTGTAISAIQTILFSIIIHILSKKISIEDINDHDIFMQSQGYKSIITTAQNMLSKAKGIPKSDINTTLFFTAAMDNGNIGLGFGNKEYLESKYPKIPRIGSNVRFEDLDSTLERKIEYSIINFGGFFDEFYTRETYFDIQKQYSDIFSSYKMNNIDTSLATNEMNFLYLKVFEAERNIIKTPNNEDLIKALFNQINKLGSYQAFLEDYMSLYRDIVSTFKKNMVFQDEEMGLITISSAKPGGTFLCITKSGKSRTTLQKTLDELHVMGYPTVNFQYCSRQDGISRDHLQIEQYLDKEHFSDYIKEGDVILECYGNDCGKKMIGHHRKLLEMITDGITFDCIDGKIYVNKEMTNHDEILTQSGTVEIIKVLLENAGEYVKNSQLPISSYTKNKNEIVGKIIGPLQELAQKNFNDKLDLQCTGNIVNFDLKLVPSKIKLHLIKSIH